MALTGNQERAILEIDGQPYEVVSLAGEEAISRLFRFDIVCAAAEGGPPPSALLAQAVTITIRDGFGAERLVHGIIAEAAASVFDDGSAHLSVVVRPAVYPLTLTRDAYLLQDVDVIDVVKDVLAEHKGPVRYEIGGTYPKRVYCAQYREDDWTFVSRLLEEEGIYYWFDHRGGQTTLVFSDTSAAAPDLDGGALVPFAYESGMTAPTELIEELGSETQATSTKFTVGSFDWKRPSFKVSGSVGSGPLEVYQARGANPESPAVCEARARTMLEGANAARRTSSGLSSSIRLVPGMVFELNNHPLARLDGRYLVTEATTRIVQRRRGVVAAEAKPYECRFRAIRAETTYRPPQTSPLAKQAGLQSGVVVGAAAEEVFPDADGRVRVQLHWDRQGKRDEEAGKWLRVAQRGTASSMLLPRVGWTILTFNEEGHVDAPHVLARIYDGEHLPPYSLPGNKTRVVFKTATTPGGGSFNEIYFEDTLGAEEMFINASRDMNVYVQNLKSDYVFNDARRDIGVNHDLSVESESLHHVSRDQTMSIGADESVAVQSERAKTVTGNEAVSIGGMRTLKTGQGHENNVTGDRTLTVGAALIDTTLGGISAIAKNKHKMLVGGAAVKVAAKSMSEDVGTLSAQTIGGIKFEKAKDERILDVRKVYLETVGGVMLLKSSKRYIDHANTKSSWIVGGKATAKAPDIWIEAKDKIELKCGGSVIVVLPDSVEIKADKFDLSQAGHLDSDTQVIEHN